MVALGSDNVKFLSVCSGIEAASVAWKPFGWQAVGVSEIEAFPCAVLAHHYPDVPNFGDLTKWREWDVPEFDVLAGGTPCQGFSVAGRRGGFQDPRSQLAFDFLGIARCYQPRWIVWENVPGVLSSDGGRDFGAFLGELGKCGYGFAYRVLDAQYFGLAQRRKRVFVVGHLGDWRPAAAVLLEPESLRGDSPPSREAGERAAATVSASPPSRRNGGSDPTVGHLVAPSLRSSGPGCARTGDSRGQDPVVAIRTAQTSSNGRGHDTERAYTLDGTQGQAVAHTLKAEGHDASEDGTGRGVPLTVGAMVHQDHGGVDTQSALQGYIVPAVFDPNQVTSKANRSTPTPDLSHTLPGVGNAPVAFNLRGREGGAMPELDDVASVRAASGGSSRSYLFVEASKNDEPDAVVYQGDRVIDESSLWPTLPAQGANNWGGAGAVLRQAMAVRRLTPTECARLQGFPDDYLDIIYRNKPAADGPKYKALGNSWAVPCARWIGERIQAL